MIGDSIKFGPSGNSNSFYECGLKHTEQAPEYLVERGLDCFEYSFGRGVRMTDQKAVSIGKAFEKQNIEISVHAPYYINFANESAESVEKSYAYMLESARVLKLMGGKRIVLHSATQGKLQRDKAVQLTKERLVILASRLKENNFQDVLVCVETMGKMAQIGTVEEVVELCTADEMYIPCFDFGHINAREQGSLLTVNDYKDRLEYMIEKLGYERVKHFHTHFSKIEYGKKGEIRHLTFEDTMYGPEFTPLAVALRILDLQPHIICESDGTQAEDAQAMKKIYETV